MNLLQLAWKNLSGNAFRSWVVFLCALLVAAFALFGTLVMQGAAASLQMASDRMGADILVVPEGAEESVEGAIMMGIPAKVWMPKENLQQLAALPEVEAISPQVYLETLTGASCCSVPAMFMVAFDPETDFTVQPWIKGSSVDELKVGEVVAGSNITATEGDHQVRVYGYMVTIKANLEPTGTGLDQSMFFTLDTAREIARVSETAAEKPLSLPSDNISAVLIKVKQGSDPRQAALRILRNVPGVTPIESANLFQSSRKQLSSLLQVMVVLIGMTWALSVLLISLIFSMAANERRRELGVLRALGATRRFISKSLIAEAGLLAICGAAAGIVLAVMAVFLFRRLIIVSLGIPFLLPSVPSLLVMIGVGLLLTLGSVCLAALIPANRISRQDPAAAMRE